MSFVRGFFSSLLTILLIVVLTVFSIVVPVGKILTVDGAKATVKSVINTTFDALANLGEGEEATGIAKVVITAVENAGIPQETAKKLFADEEVTNVVSGLVAEALLSKMDKNVEVEYPSKDVVTSIMKRNAEALSQAFDFELAEGDAENEEKLAQLAEEHYDEIIDGLKSVVEQFAEATENGEGGEQ